MDVKMASAARLLIAELLWEAWLLFTGALNPGSMVFQ